MTTIFVFGSNLAGRHGKGAALHARRYRGAIYGQGAGLQGESYAIPTKDANLRTLALEEIQRHVDGFKSFVTPVGCGLAGYSPGQIAPMFKGAPANCLLPDVFLEVLLDQGNPAA
jgi:hypothetical protein